MARAEAEDFPGQPPVPAECSCEGFPILTAYALLRDWDRIDGLGYGRGR